MVDTFVLENNSTSELSSCNVRCHLEPNHRSHLRKDSNISDEVMNDAGLFSVDAGAAKEIIGVSAQGIAFLYLDLSGDVIGHRLRLDASMDSKKYLQKEGTSLTAYFVKKSISNILNTSTTLYVTEGEKKLLSFLSCCEYENEAIVSFPGCWNWKVKGEDRLGGIWEEIPLKGRKLVLLPDSDFFKTIEVWNGITSFIRLALKSRR